MRLTIVILSAIPLVLGGCGANKREHSDARVEAGGSGTTRNYDVSGFTQVEARGSDDVEVKIGPAFAVRAEGDPKVLDRLEIAVHGNELRIARRGNSNWMFGGSNDRGARIFVTMPRVEGASVSGSGNMTVERAEGDFAASVAGSGNLDIARLDAQKASLSVAGSGNMNIAGRTGGLDVSVVGSGDLDAPELTATSASISGAGSGNVRAKVAGGASVSVVGSGDVELGGGAKCAVSKAGSGDVRCS